MGAIIGLINWLYLKVELMEWTNILHGRANLEKLKVVSVIFGWAWSEMGMAT